MILEWNKSCIGLIALYVHPKNSLRSHLGAIMALDHSRLSVENKFLENKSGRIFCGGQVYFTNSCQQIYLRIHLINQDQVMYYPVDRFKHNVQCIYPENSPIILSNNYGQMIFFRIKTTLKGCFSMFMYLKMSEWILYDGNAQSKERL